MFSVFVKNGIVFANAVGSMQSAITHMRSRVPGYDVLRVVSMVAVVAIHCLMLLRATTSPSSPVVLLDTLLHFAVPVFFFVSGALVWGRYSGRTVEDYVHFLRRRTVVVIAPYLAWSSLYLLIAAARGYWPYWLTHTPALLLTGRSWYHLYFIPVLVFFYVLTPLVAPAARRYPELLVATAYAARLLLVEPVTRAASTVGGPLLVTFAVVTTTHASHMALGAWFATRKDALRPVLRRVWPLALTLGSLVLVAQSRGLVPALPDTLQDAVVPAAMALTVLGLAGLAFGIRMNPTTADKTARLGSLALGVYIAHPVLLLVWRSAITAVGGALLLQSPWFSVVSVTVITASSFGLSALLSRGRATAWLVGSRPPPRSAAAIAFTESSRVRSEARQAA